MTLKPSLLAGMIAGFFGFMVNAIVQFFLFPPLNLWIALATGFGLFLIFAIVSSRYSSSPGL